MAANEVATILNALPDDVDAVLANAHKMLVRRFSVTELETLFDEQLKTLADRGCDGAIIEQLRTLRTKVICTTSKIIFRRGHIPFLSIIPPEVLNPEKQAAMIDWDGRRGRTDGWVSHSRDADIEQAETLPKYPYYIVGVGIRKVQREDNLSPIQAAQTIVDEGELPLNVAEGISLAIQGAKLNRSYHIRTYFLHEQLKLKNSDRHPRAYTLHGESQICPSSTIPVVSLSCAHLGEWFSVPHCGGRISTP